MDIDNMQAGSEMDKLVAEKIFHYTWKWVEHRTSNNDCWKRWYDDSGRQVMTFGVTKFSTDIAAAWEVDRRMDNLGLRLEYLDNLEIIIGHKFEGNDYSGSEWALLRASPSQRCRAALKTIGDKQT